MSTGRDGRPRPAGALQTLEIDALALLRNDKRTAAAMRDRLNARYYLLTCRGWTVDQVNEARDHQERITR